MESEIYHLIFQKMSLINFFKMERRERWNKPVGKRTRSDNTAALLPSQGSKAMGLGES